MEKKLKETLDTALDRLLHGTLQNTYYEQMDKKFLGLVKSKRDFLFGVVVGDMLEGLGFCTFGAYKRHPRDEEFKELFKTIRGRSKEIQEKIKTILAH
ncbi:MAG: hypothetical protein JSW72_03030 [Candidatus Bathyarchaeota archaeon]|nr:MAG: hypothetical protein JSW72_03030 [Candidatus Bathyarchaeota archaeon]